MWLVAGGEQAGLGGIASASATSQGAAACVAARDMYATHATVESLSLFWYLEVDVDATRRFPIASGALGL